MPPRKKKAGATNGEVCAKQEAAGEDAADGHQQAAAEYHHQAGA